MFPSSAAAWGSSATPSSDRRPTPFQFSWARRSCVRRERRGFRRCPPSNLHRLEPRLRRARPSPRQLQWHWVALWACEQALSNSPDGWIVAHGSSFEMYRRFRRLSLFAEHRAEIEFRTGIIAWISRQGPSTSSRQTARAVSPVFPCAPLLPR